MGGKGNDCLPVLGALLVTSARVSDKVTIQ